ncbi:MAG: hypothetical protein ACKV2T_43515 [Kofleriaceae bacterium]
MIDATTQRLYRILLGREGRLADVGEDLRRERAGDVALVAALDGAPYPITVPDTPLPEGWVELERWAVSSWQLATPWLDAEHAHGLRVRAEDLVRGLALDLVRCRRTYGAVVGAARVLRWLAVVPPPPEHRDIVDTAALHVAAEGGMSEEVAFHLDIRRRLLAR